MKLSKIFGILTSDFGHNKTLSDFVLRCRERKEMLSKNFVTCSLVLRAVIFVARYMYDARRQDFALSASFVSELERFHGSEVTGKVNDSIVRKQCCVAEEILELRSRRGKYIYDRTYNSVGLNKVSHFSRRGRANSRPPMIEKNKIFVTENTESESFCM